MASLFFADHRALFRGWLQAVQEGRRSAQRTVVRGPRDGLQQHCPAAAPAASFCGPAAPTPQRETVYPIDIYCW